MPIYSRLLYILLGSLLTASLVSCGQAPSKYSKAPAEDATIQRTLSRADPGYMQYLERQSMLASTTELSRIVSGSDIAWRHAGSPPNPERFLGIGSAWLRVHPQTVLGPGRRSPFEQLSSPITWSVLTKSNLNGLYIAPTGASGTLWDYGRNASLSGGEDVIQYSFALGMGKDDDYRAILQSASASRGMTGADLIPAATGLGPDFFLAARAMREYPGIYCMMEVPKDLWPLLPSIADEWTAKALDAEHVVALAEKNVIPRAMVMDSQPTLPPSGWAVTGEVRGVDGALRRWVYRYFIEPRRPVLNWEDPSGTAKRIISGSAIRQVGLFGNALVGFRVSPWMGLDAKEGGQNAHEQPARAAAVSISREVRRYGGWSWLRDEVTLPFMQDMLQDGPDFIHDSVFSPAAEHALLTGDASLLRFMTDEALEYRLNLTRMVHSTTAQDGVNYALPHLQWMMSSPTIDEEKRKKARTLLESVMAELALVERPESQVTLLEGNVLYSTPVGLAALAMGAEDPSKLPKESLAEARQGHLLLLFYKAMQPGVFMPSGQDLLGVLPLSWKSTVDRPEQWDKRISALGSYPLLTHGESVTVNAQGIPRANTIYQPVDVQTHDANSFLAELGALLQTRRTLELDHGQLVGRLPSNGRGVIATVYKLPDQKSFIIAVYNFDRTISAEKLFCGALPELEKALHDHAPKSITGQVQNVAFNSSSLHLDLPGWTAGLIYVGEKH